MYWSLNICRFNYSIDKKTKILNEIAKEADIDFGSKQRIKQILNLNFKG